VQSDLIFAVRVNRGLIILTNAQQQYNSLQVPYFIKYSAHFLLKKDDEILSAHYTWKVVENRLEIKGKMWCWERLVGWNLENKKNVFFCKNHCKIKECTILECTLYSIKYGNSEHVLFTKVYSKCQAVSAWCSINLILIEITSQEFLSSSLYHLSDNCDP
jgi:hypothetical protein